MKTFHTDILGSDYEVNFGKQKKLGLSGNLDGQCAFLIRKILVEHSMRDCDTEEERDVRTANTLAHEVFHAYVHESGLDIDEYTEEKLATWYEVMWRKMNNTILEVLDDMKLLDSSVKV